MNQALMFTSSSRSFERIEKLPDQQRAWIARRNRVEMIVGGKLAASRWRILLTYFQSNVFVSTSI